jgi:hypothetical protein
MSEDKKRKGAPAEKAAKLSKARQGFAKVLQDLHKANKFFIENWRDFSNKAANPTAKEQDRFQHAIKDFRKELRRIRRDLKHVKCP